MSHIIPSGSNALVEKIRVGMASGAVRTTHPVHVDAQRDEPSRPSFRFSARLSGNYFIRQAAGERQRRRETEGERDREAEREQRLVFFG